MLSPYAKKPRTSAAITVKTSVVRSPTASPIEREAAPEQSPLIMTICIGSFDDSLRVQLFSSPQQTQARSIRSDPKEKPNPVAPSTDRRMLAVVMSPIAAHRRAEIFSPKKVSANTAVATISKLLSSTALAALDVDSPSISSIGAATSSTTIPTVYGRSARDRAASFLRFGDSTRSKNTPAPAPRYSIPASSVAGMSFKSSFETGAFSAYSNAAANAQRT